MRQYLYCIFHFSSIGIALKVLCSYMLGFMDYSLSRREESWKEKLFACLCVCRVKKHSFSTLLRLVIDHRNLVGPGVVEVEESESGYKLGVKGKKNIFSIYVYFQSLMIGTWLNLEYSGSRSLNLSKKSRLKVEKTSAKRSTEMYGTLKRSVLGYRLWRIRIYL